MNDSIVVALRVLSCIQKQQAPNRADIEHLQGLVSESYRCAAADELACIVIRAELRKKQPKIMYATA